MTEGCGSTEHCWTTAGRLPNSAKMESLDILEESVVGPLAAVLVPLLETLQREN